MTDKRLKGLSVLLLSGLLAACASQDKPKTAPIETNQTAANLDTNNARLESAEKAPVEDHEPQITPVSEQATAETTTIDDLPLKQEPNNIEFKDKESIYLPNFDLNVFATANLESDDSLLYVVSLEEFERNSQSWVKFAVDDNGKLSRFVALPIISRDSEKQAPVVTMWAHMGDKRERVRFVLSTENNQFPLVLGQSFYKSLYL